MWLARRLPSPFPPAQRWVSTLFLALGATVLNVEPARAGDLFVEEQEAVHLQRFVSYIEWPSSSFVLPTSAIVVGIAGAEHTLAILTRAVAGKAIHGRPVHVRPLQRPDQIGSAHLAYIGHEAWDRLSEWITAAKAHDVVLATNAPDGVGRGATLGLIQVDQRTRFEASVPAATEVGVKLSARLLEVAERVVGHQP